MRCIPHSWVDILLFLPFRSLMIIDFLSLFSICPGNQLRALRNFGALLIRVPNRLVWTPLDGPNDPLERVVGAWYGAILSRKSSGTTYRRFVCQSWPPSVRHIRKVTSKGKTGRDHPSRSSSTALRRAISSAVPLLIWLASSTAARSHNPLDL
jgi:hypothetical protein